MHREEIWIAKGTADVSVTCFLILTCHLESIFKSEKNENRKMKNKSAVLH